MLQCASRGGASIWRIFEALENQNLELPLLEDIAAHANEVSRKAGDILLDYFNRPLEIQFKGKGKTDPVTVADGRSEAYVKAAILERYPRHSIVSEEAGALGDSDSPFVWVVDPLDGTANFMNGLPFFAVSIGVLWKGEPVAGSVFVPVSHKGTPGVYHARLGNGAYLDKERIETERAQTGRPLSAMPPGGSFRLSGQSGRTPHEVRNTGSIAVELVLTASGVFQYAMFGRPRIWDVAAGVLLVKEAGGEVFSQQPNKREWLPLERFEPRRNNDQTMLEQLLKWSGPVVVSGRHTAAGVVKDLRGPRFPLWTKALWWHSRSEGRTRNNGKSLLM